MFDLEGKLKSQISAQIDYGEHLLKVINLPSKVLAASDSGIIKFLSYDGELRYKSNITIKGLS